MDFGIFSGSVGVGIALLLGIAFLKYSGFMDAIRKEVGYIASGAIFLLLSAVVSTITPAISIPGTQYVELIFVVIAFILVLIGAIAMAIQIFAKLR